ncbi:MAG TPA: WbqC family protein [Candidatus Saccharimonadales bacterium]|nr:WbqC family protein [Candidatus Saccharimonadales bacterium]
MSNTTTLVINQPTFLPWIGYFDLIHQADIFVILDTVQFSRQSWQQRNRVKTSQGATWLTIPIERNFGDLITEVKINYSTGWVSKQLKTLELNYKKTLFFEEIFPEVAKIYNANPKYLVDLNVEIIKFFVDYLGLNTKIVLAHDLPLKKIDKLSYILDICNFVHANRYLNGQAGVKLYNPDDFKRKNIELVFHNFQHPVYNQLHGDFIPYLSIFDVACNLGPETRSLLNAKT